MSKYKILFINGHSEIGGGDIILLDLVKGLDREKFIPLIVLPRVGPLVDEFRKSKAEVKFINMSVIERSYNPLYYIFYFLKFVPSVLRVKALIRKEGISLVHTNSSTVLSGAIAARLCGIPHVWHVREIILHPKFVSRSLVNIIGMLSDRIITMTEAIRDTFPEKYKRMEKLQTIYDGIDFNNFISSATPGAFRKEYGIEPDTPLVGMVSRMIPWKGHRDFIRAAVEVKKSLPRARFVIVGDIVRKRYRHYREELKDSVRKLGLDGSLIFTGVRQDIPNIMSDLDCLVLPSSSPEPSGRVILEAMAISKPVVATDHGGPRELVIPGVTGMLVPSRDHRAMATAIRSLLQNKQVAAKMGSEGKKKIEQFFSLNGHVRKVERIYHTLLNSD